MLEVGSIAPDFTLQGLSPESEEKTYSLAGLLKLGKPIVLYFYPKDNTPGCTTESCDFRDRAVVNSDRALILGVSPDSIKSHRNFQEKHQLNFPLLSDPDKQVLQAYGAFGEKKLYGKVSMGVIRSTFVIGPDGLIKASYRNVKVNGHAEKVLGAL